MRRLIPVLRVIIRFKYGQVKINSRGENLEPAEGTHFTRGRQDRQCPKCKEWELNEDGICNRCGYRESGTRFEK
jgi:hypothetical protein